MKTVRYLRLVLLLIPACWSNSGFAQSDSLQPDTIAVVGGKALLRSSFEAQQKYDNEDEKKKKGNTNGCGTLEQMLNEKLLLQQAEKEGIKVDESWVENELKRRLDYFIKLLGSEEKLIEFYGIDKKKLYEEFRQALRERYLMLQMQNLVYKNIKVSDADVEQFYASIPKDSMPHIDEQIEVAHIVKHILPTKEQKKAAIKKLKELRKEIKKGQRSFETVALLHSSDPGSAKSSGDLGWQTKGVFVKEFEKQVLKLKKGKISKVFETKYGYHIVELLDRKDDKFHCRHILMIPKITIEQAKTIKEELSQVQAKIELGTITFKEAVQRYSDDDNTKERAGVILNSLSTADSSLFFPKEMDRELMLLINKMEVGEVSHPISHNLNGGTKKAMRLVKYNRNIPSHLANLKNDFKMFYSAALKEKQQKAMIEWMHKTIANTDVWMKNEFHSCRFVYNWLKK